MAVSVPKRISIRKYQSEKCDRITLDIPKGKREAYKLIAAEAGKSLAQLVQDSVEGYAANHTGGEFVPSTTTTETLTAEDRRTLERLNSLPKSTRAKFTGLLADYAALVDKGGDWNGDDGRTS